MEEQRPYFRAEEVREDFLGEVPPGLSKADQGDWAGVGRGGDVLEREVFQALEVTGMRSRRRG